MRAVLCRCVLREGTPSLKLCAGRSAYAPNLRLAQATRICGFSRSGQAIRIRDAVSSLNPAANNFSGLAGAKKYFLLFDNGGFDGIGVSWGWRAQLVEF